MLQKRSNVVVGDNCGAWTARVFHIYRGSRHRTGIAADFVKVSIRQASPLSKIKKGYKSKAIIVRVRSMSKRRDGSYVRFEDNNVVLLKKRLTPRGKELHGPITYGFHRRKFTATFLGVA